MAANDKPQVLIGNRSGVILDEIDPEIGPISWRLNDIGQVVLMLSKTNNKLKSSLFAKNNRVAIRFANGLIWGGVVSYPVRWTLDGAEFTIKGPGQLLKRRVSDSVKQFSAASVGGIISGLLQDLNASEYPVNINIGEIDGTGAQFSPTFNLVNVYDTLINVSRNWTLKDHDFITTVENGIIEFTFNLYSQRGQIRPNVEFIQGHNIVNLELNEQGPPINFWRVVGAGTVWTDRIIVEAADIESIADHGINESTKFETSISNQPELQSIANNLLSKTARLSNIYVLTVINKANAAFSDYIVGDIVKLYAPNIMFSGLDQLVRIIAKEYDPNNGIMSLAVQDWNE